MQIIVSSRKGSHHTFEERRGGVHLRPKPQRKQCEQLVLPDGLGSGNGRGVSRDQPLHYDNGWGQNKPIITYLCPIL